MFYCCERETIIDHIQLSDKTEIRVQIISVKSITVRRSRKFSAALALTNLISFPCRSLLKQPESPIASIRLSAGVLHSVRDIGVVVPVTQRVT